MKLTGKTHEGTPVIVIFEDLRDRHSLYDEGGFPYRGMTSSIVIDGAESFSKVPIDTLYGERLDADRLHLEERGIDTTTLVDESGEPVFESWETGFVRRTRRG